MELTEKVEDPNQGARQFKKYAIGLLSRWYYIIGFLIVCLLAAFAINRYEVPVFKIKARIITKKFSESSSSTPVPGLVDANFFMKGMTEIYEEIPTLKSLKRIETTVDRIDYRVSYFAEGLIKTTEFAKGVGFDVQVDSIAESGCPLGIPIFVNHLDSKKFELHIDNDQWAKLVKGRQYLFGAPIKIGKAVFRVINTNGKTAENDTYYFLLNKRQEVINRYRNALRIDWAIKGSAMLDLSMESELPEKDIEFMKAYYTVVEELALQDKNETLDNTINFIDTQMKLINDSVVFYQALIDDIKLKNLQLNLGPDLLYAKFSELDLKNETLGLNQLYLDYLAEYFKKNKSSEIFVPSISELTTFPLMEWVTQYINERLNDKLYKTDENARNPLIIREDSSKNKLVKGIFESIRSTKERNQDGATQIEQKRGELRGSLKDFQSDFRALSQYVRLYTLNLTLYDLLMRRRFEATVSKASATSDYKIIEAPSYGSVPFKPDKLLNYSIAAVLGFLLPVVFFLYRDFTNPCVVDKDDLKAHLDMPILGYVPHSPFATINTLSDHPRSLVIEAFRAIRANLRYMTVSKPEGALTYLITSCVAGEGKTFCSINLAQSMVISNKKTILLGADLRRSTFKNYFKELRSKGLSEYLAGLASFDDVLLKGSENLPDIISSGSVPPNPSELLAGQRMHDLLTQLKATYDYIIIDTPPIGLISDAVELLKLTDANFLIARQHVTHKAALDMINELYAENKIQHFSVIFNDVSIETGIRGMNRGYTYGLGYGGYGYGYYEEDKRKKKKES